ncbi:PREDICTED: uncharacterized protein LOC104740223 [Camelina sativa]|uniref:Uncharacterized protein LOC104740223 n=1 Tax=Camelina sativa TaxID=90675 RepID=A0ABM0VP24_CAMSA|nr:PREDICTED: uncharacterized protein LOC104740223 [Camelina sativa]
MSSLRGQIASRPMREIFLTSSSLSFSSLSSSVSWDDAIELNLKESKASSSEDKSHHQQINGEFSNASSSSQGTEMSGSTHVKMRPPVLLMDKGVGNYDPERIPPSVFGKTGDVTWSELSNESLFSLTFEGNRKSNAQAPRQTNIKAEEVLMSPSLLSTPEEAKEKRSEVREIKSGETRVETQSRIHQEKYYSLSTQDVPLSSIPSNFYCLYAPPPKRDQYYSLPAGGNKSKKRKKTRKSKMKKKKDKKKKKTEEEKKKNKCCMWSWLSSVFSKCECDLSSCYKWRKCCCAA